MSIYTDYLFESIKKKRESYPEHRAATMKMVKMKSRRAVIVNPETQTHVREIRNTTSTTRTTRRKLNITAAVQV